MRSAFGHLHTSHDIALANWAGEGAVGGGGGEIEPWISPPPSTHNSSMPMGTMHIERWRGNSLSSFYEPSHSSTRGLEDGERE